MQIGYHDSKINFCLTSPSTIGFLENLEHLCIRSSKIIKKKDVNWIHSSSNLVKSLKTIEIISLSNNFDISWQFLAKFQNLNHLKIKGCYMASQFKPNDVRKLGDILPNLECLSLDIELFDLKLVLDTINSKLRHLHTLHIDCYQQPGLFQDFDEDDQVQPLMNIRKLTIFNRAHSSPENVRKWIQSVPFLFPKVKFLAMFFPLDGRLKARFECWTHFVFTQVYLKEIEKFPNRMTDLKYFKLWMNENLKKENLPDQRQLKRHFISSGVQLDFVSFDPPFLFV